MDDGELLGILAAAMIAVVFLLIEEYAKDSE